MCDASDKAEHSLLARPRYLAQNPCQADLREERISAGVLQTDFSVMLELNQRLGNETVGK